MDFLDFLGDDDGPAAVAAISSDDEAETPAVPRGPSALAVSLARLRQNLSSDAYAQLDKQGFLVLDNVFEQQLAERFATEISSLHSLGHTALNSTALVSEHRAGEQALIARLIAKPHVFETELTSDVRARLREHMPELCALYDALPGLEVHMAALAPQLQLSVGEQRSSIKLQYNSGGCFPFHFDSPGGLKDSRRLTMLLYLNDDWERSHGGQLVLQPFLTPAVSVAPRFNRIVLFKSDAVLHRVMPTKHLRRCLTIWFHCKQAKQTQQQTTDAAPAEADPAAATAAGSGSGPDASASPSPSESDSFADVWLSRLGDPTWQRVLARYVYLDEWRRSFFEAHGRADDATAAAAAAGASGARVSYVSGGAAAPAAVDASVESGGVASLGAEPLVESLEADAARLEVQLRGTGVLQLLRQTADAYKHKTIEL